MGVERRASEGEDFESLRVRATDGDTDALAELYRRHAPMIERYLRSAAGSDGADLASDTWIDIARSLERFTGDEDGFRGWAFTIARRRLIDHQRRSRRRAEDPGDRDGLAGHRAADDPASAALSAVGADALAAEVRRVLSEEQAEIVLLRVVGGLSAEEVAELTGRRPGTVRVLQHRALKKLASRLRFDEV